MAYSQWKAMFSITRASLRAITRSPSAVIFSFIFPFIFILVFGFIGDNAGQRSLKVVIDQHSDTLNPIYQALKQMPGIKIRQYNKEDDLLLDLQKGRIAGIVHIQATPGKPMPYEVRMNSTTSSNDQWPQLKAMLETLIAQVSNQLYPNRPSVATFAFNPEKDIREIRQYKTIDFILPGQLGFSLLSAGVFGVAFMFFNLRNTLVLKRFFATPINRTFIILGEGLSRVLFQMVTAVVIIGVGYLFFGFTLVHGLETFIEMLFLSFLALVVFMGFGFIVSGLAKNDSSIPPFANLITLPQFLMGGTFFPVEAFPSWLQPISKALPLTHLNTAMRSVAFEGQNLWDVRMEILILLGWGVLVYALAVKFFRWE